MSTRNRRFERIVELGCIVCRLYYSLYTPPEIHHTRFNRGIGHKKDDTSTIGLCLHHHRVGPLSFHEGRTRFLEEFTTEEELLEIQNKLLERNVKQRN